jgi:hypothetical protein
VTSTSFMSYVHRNDGKKRFHKSLRKEENYLRKCGSVEVDEYTKCVIEEEGLPLTFEKIVEDICSKKI